MGVELELVLAIVVAVVLALEEAWESSGEWVAVRVLSLLGWRGGSGEVKSTMGCMRFCIPSFLLHHLLHLNW